MKFNSELVAMEWNKLTVAIVGLGLMGASYAKGLRNLGVHKIIGIEKDKSTLFEAENLGIIDLALHQPDETLRLADVIILAIYPEQLLAFSKSMIPFLKDNVLITDIAGIKNDIIGKIQQLLPITAEFISGHPMAGRQAKGLGMSDAAIFNNANYIIIAHNNSKEAISCIDTMAHALGCRYTTCVSPEEHDKIIAYTSDLPHISAIALVNSESFSGKTKYFVAGSFRDGTRVADINPELWANLFIANSEKVANEIDRYIVQLEIWRSALRNKDIVTLKEQMKKAASRRKGL